MGLEGRDIVTLSVAHMLDDGISNSLFRDLVKNQDLLHLEFEGFSDQFRATPLCDVVCRAIFGAWIRGGSSTNESDTISYQPDGEDGENGGCSATWSDSKDDERIQLENDISEVSPVVFNDSFFRDLVKNQDLLCLESERALVTNPELRRYMVLDLVKNQDLLCLESERALVTNPELRRYMVLDLVKNQDSLRLESERALVTNPELCRYVMLYAEDKDAFLRYYAISHQRFLELGFEVDQVQTRVIQFLISRLARMAKMVVALLLEVIAVMMLASRTL
ncbi:hypothetical protein QYF36_007981 [Acer negundo]|nr:hypothetical protein QYF36_007981 [Acer negundo]